MNSIMYNTYIFNWQYFDWITPFDIEIFSWEIVYNGYILHQTNVCSISMFQGYNWPTLQLNNFDLPNTDWVGNNSAFYRANEFRVRGTIKAESAEKLRAEKDRFKRFMAEQNKTLQVNFNWEFRRAKAFVLGLDNLWQDQHYNLTFIPFELRFEIQQWYWEDIRKTTLTYGGITETLQEEINNTGTYKAFPIFVINFITADLTDEVRLTMWDNEILISETLTNGDIIIINSLEKEVLVNWVPIDFDGVFPILNVGLNPFSIEINWTYEADISTQYTKTFI